MFNSSEWHSHVYCHLIGFLVSHHFIFPWEPPPMLPSNLMSGPYGMIYSGYQIKDNMTQALYIYGQKIGTKVSNLPPKELKRPIYLLCMLYFNLNIKIPWEDLNVSDVFESVWDELARPQKMRHCHILPTRSLFCPNLIKICTIHRKDYDKRFANFNNDRVNILATRSLNLGVTLSGKNIVMKILKVDTLASH